MHEQRRKVARLDCKSALNGLKSSIRLPDRALQASELHVKQIVVRRVFCGLEQQSLGGFQISRCRGAVRQSSMIGSRHRHSE
jgi:hypothetical protein